MQTTREMTVQDQKNDVKLAEQIRNYIRHRAKQEGVEFRLSLSIFEKAVACGAIIFGVHHDGEKMLRDDQEPYPGFFQKWTVA